MSSQTWVCLKVGQRPRSVVEEILPLVPILLARLKDQDYEDCGQPLASNGKVVMPRETRFESGGLEADWMLKITGHSWLSPNFACAWRHSVSAKRSTFGQKFELFQIELWIKTDQANQDLLTIRFVQDGSLAIHRQIQASNAAGRIHFGSPAELESHLGRLSRFAGAVCGAVDRQLGIHG